jgi:response regulator NasT
MNEPRTATIKVAVAEDDPGVRQVLERLLKKLGYDVGCAVDNGSALLEQCRRQRFDVVVVDLDMPVMDGLEAAEEIAAGGVPVILISGVPDLDEIVVDREPIITALAKPILLPALRNAVELALANRP